MNIQDIIDKVQKLRRLATSANLNEAQNAAAIAERLIAQHQLSEVELSVEKGISEPIIEAETFLYETGKVVQWKKNLAIMLARHYNVYVYNNVDYGEDGRGRKKSRFAMIGKPSNIAILEYQFAFLMQEITRLSSNMFWYLGAGISVERNSFCEGAVSGIMDKLRAEKKEVSQTASSSALMVMQKEYNEAMGWANQKHNLKHKSTASYAHRDVSMYNLGREAGGQITINAGLNAAQKGRLLNK